MTTEKLYTKEQLHAAFSSGISYWSAHHGWEENAFEQWMVDSGIKAMENAQILTSAKPDEWIA